MYKMLLFPGDKYSYMWAGELYSKLQTGVEQERQIDNLARFPENIS